jgi:hypothetical protein
LVRCQADIEIDQEAVLRVGATMQGREPGEDEVLVVFPGNADSRAIADFERVMMFGNESGRGSERWVPSLA